MSFTRPGFHDIDSKVYRIAEVIKEHKTIIISRHVRPDGDAYGSSHGLATILKSAFKDKDIYVINDDQTSVAEMFPAEDEQLPDEVYKEALLIVTDCATADRISNSKWELAKQVVRIDHHPVDDNYASEGLSWVVPEAAATCELIVELGLQVPEFSLVDTGAAEYLYIGLVTDTLRFRLNNTTAHTFYVAYICMREGLNLQKIAEDLYLEDERVLEVRGEIYQNLLHTRNGIVYTVLDKNLQEDYDLTEEQAGDIIDEIGMIRGCPIYVVLVEMLDGKIRMKIRSRTKTINHIAAKHGGGGHEQAAGCILNYWDECYEVLDELDALLEEKD